MADAGKGPAEIAAAVEDRWHIEYPATNNAVANGGIVAIAVWFGRYVDDERILSRIIEAPRAAQKEASIVWQSIREDLLRFAGRQIQIRLYQLVLFTDRVAGTAYWRALALK
jgi:hypothetical protein